MRRRCCPGQHERWDNRVVPIARVPSVLLILLFLAGVPHARAEIPVSAPNCGLNAPPAAAARGARPPHAYPMRMHPAEPGHGYTGCLWIWISYSRSDVYEYSSVAYYVAGMPKVHRVTFPPMGGATSIQTCLYDGYKEPKRTTQGPDLERACHSPFQLHQLLMIKPVQDGWWDFF